MRPALLFTLIFFSFLFVKAQTTYGLLAHYPFHGNANDEGPEHNHATVLGATLTSDRFGKEKEAYLFDGVDDIIVVNHTKDYLEPSEAISISVYIKPMEQCGGGERRDCRIMRKSGHESPGYMLSWCQNNNMIEFRTDGIKAFNIGINHTPYIGDWHHVVTSYDQNTGTAKMYIDGELVVSQSGLNYQMQHSDDKLYIGGFTTGTFDEFFFGAIDDVRIYNRVLSEDEIRSLYTKQEVNHGDSLYYKGKWYARPDYEKAKGDYEKQNFDTWFMPGVAYMFYQPKDYLTTGTFSGPAVEYMIYGKVEQNDNPGPSHVRVYSKFSILNSDKDQVPSLFIYTLGLDLSLEKNPNRTYLIPYFGLETGGISQKTSGSTLQFSPTIGVHILSRKNLFLNLHGGYVYPVSDFERMQGWFGQAGLNFSLW